MDQWQMRDAKNKLSELVEKARTDGPQVITRRGEAAAVIVSFEAYEALTRPAEGLVAFFERSPLCGVGGDFTRSLDTGRGVDMA